MNRQDAKHAKIFEPPRRQARQDYSLKKDFLGALASWRFKHGFLGGLGVLAVQRALRDIGAH